MVPYDKYVGLGSYLGWLCWLSITFESSQVGQTSQHFDVSAHFQDANAMSIARSWYTAAARQFLRGWTDERCNYWCRTQLGKRNQLITVVVCSCSGRSVWLMSIDHSLIDVVHQQRLRFIVDELCIWLETEPISVTNDHPQCSHHSMPTSKSCCDILRRFILSIITTLVVWIRPVVFTKNCTNRISCGCESDWLPATSHRFERLPNVAGSETWAIGLSLINCLVVWLTCFKFSPLPTNGWLVD